MVQFFGSIIAVTAPAAKPTPMEIASPVSFMAIPPFGSSMPEKGRILSEKTMTNYFKISFAI